MKNTSYSQSLLFVIALFCLVLNSVSAAAEIKSLDEAINIAGQQRTLTQQMLKNNSLIIMKVRERKARQELARETALFDAQLAQLNQFAKDASAQQQLSQINEFWQQVKIIYALDATQTQLLKLNTNTGNLFNAIEQFIAILLKGSTTGKGALLNVANSEPMLIQKIVALYALKAAGIEAPYQHEYQKTVGEFEQNLNVLNNFANNSIKTRSQLARVGNHFKRFTATVTTNSSGNYSLAIVSAAAGKISLELTEIIASYQQLKLN
jgi:hypothetical protein